MTLRLDKQTRLKIARIARRRRVSASHVMREAIETLVDHEEVTASPYLAIAHLIGVVRGGDAKRSTQTGRRFAELLKARRRRR